MKYDQIAKKRHIHITIGRETAENRVQFHRNRIWFMSFRSSGRYTTNLNKINARCL